MAIYCQDLDTLLSAYLDGELQGHELDDLEHHLGVCPACRGRSDQEAADHARLRALLAGPAAPPTLRRDLAARLDREDRASRGRRWGLALPATASVAAAAALALFALDTFQPAAVTPAISVARMQHDAVASRFRGAPLVPASSTGDLTRSVAEYLQVPVTAPRLQGSSMRGWKPTLLAGRVAAKLVYEVDHRDRRYLVDVHLLDGRDMALAGRDRLLVNGSELWVSTTLGIHTVAFKDARGVGYVFSSDMPRGDLIDLVVRSPVVERANRVLGD